MENATENEGPKRRLIFTYGTLKRGFPNHNLTKDLIDNNDAVFLGNYSTQFSFPLIIGPYGVPYLINLPGSGRRVRGEVYAVSDPGLIRLDELEGTAVGHYDRLPVLLVGNDGDTVGIAAECYFAGRGVWEGLWSRKDGEELAEYTAREALKYVRKDQRSKRRPRI